MKTLSLKRLSIVIAIIGLLVLGLGVWLGNNASQHELAELLKVCGWVTLGVALAGGITAWRQRIYGMSQTRQARFGANALLLSGAFIGILILVNYIVYRHDFKLDLTESKSFTLSEQTIKILHGLDKNVTVKSFYRASNAQRQDVLNRLEIYRTEAGNKLSFEMIDPDRQPGLALNAGVRSDGTIILESGKARKEIYAADESQLTSAILAITRSNKPKIYFLTGHGELAWDSFEPRLGLGFMKQVLEEESYETAELSLPAVQNKVPADAAAIVIAGPEKALTADEIKGLNDYFKQRQGKLMVLLQARFSSGLETSLRQLGVQVNDNIIVDPAQNIQNDVTVPAFTAYGFHPITKELNNNVVFLPLSRSLTISTPPEHIQVTALMSTTPASWGETNLEENSLIQKDSADPAGPLTAAVALTRTDPNAAPAVEVDPADPEAQKAADKAASKDQSRMVIVGNAMFASNGFSKILGNGDFFLNSIAWLTESEDLISVRAKPTENRQLQLTGKQERWAFNISLIFMPLLVILVGFVIWWKRR